MRNVTVNSGFLVGSCFVKSTIEISIRRGFPFFKILGIAGKVTQEATERIKEAIRNNGFDFPKGKVIVNLKPVNIPKADQHFDLAIAYGILVATGQIRVNDKRLLETIFLGELTFTGQVRTSLAVIAAYIKSEETNILIASRQSIDELLQYVGELPVIKIDHIKDIFKISTTRAKKRTAIKSEINFKRKFPNGLKLKLSEGLAKTAVIAATTNLNCFFAGPPGFGKTHLVSIIHKLKNRISLENFLEQIINSNVEKISPEEIIPLRQPNQFITRGNFFGKDSPLIPGEITLATGGILSLNEFPEYRKEILDNIKTVIDQKEILLKNRNFSHKYIAAFQLIATSNPCKCGFLGSGEKDCTCAEYEIKQYFKNTSGGLLDRFGVFVFINPEDTHKEYPIEKLNNMLTQAALHSPIYSYKKNSSTIDKIRKTFNFSHRKIGFVVQIAKVLAGIYKADHVCSDHLYEAAYFTDDSKFRTMIGKTIKP